MTVANDSDSADTSSAFHGVQLRLATRHLSGAHPNADSAGAKETHFTIATQLAQHLNATTPRPLAPVTLMLVASEPGRVTVYPPEFEFDV